MNLRIQWSAADVSDGVRVEAVNPEGTVSVSTCCSSAQSFRSATLDRSIILSERIGLNYYAATAGRCHERMNTRSMIYELRLVWLLPMY